VAPSAPTGFSTSGVNSSHMMMPKENTSEALPAWSPRSRSGASQRGLMAWTVLIDVFSSTSSLSLLSLLSSLSLLSPKSATWKACVRYSKLISWRRTHGDGRMNYDGGWRHSSAAPRLTATYLDLPRVCDQQVRGLQAP
jgi:hypothetical protein